MVKGEEKRGKKVENSLKSEIIGLVLVTFAIISFLSLFFTQRMGGIGGFLERVIHYFFGKGALLFPFVLLMIAINFIRNGKNEYKNARTIGICMLLLEVLVIFHTTLPSEVYLSLAGQSEGGGLVGGLIAFALFKLFGSIGTKVILVITFLVSLILITSTSLGKLVGGLYGGIKGCLRKGVEEVSDFIFIEDDGEDYFEGANDYPRKKRDKFELIKREGIIEAEPKKKEENTQSQEGKSQILDETLITEELFKELEEGKEAKASYIKPPSYLLQKIEIKQKPRIDKSREAKLLEETLLSFGVNAKVTKISQGPTITRYELQPAPGVKVSKIVSLADDIALSLAAPDVRIEAPIPGKSAVGIEIPNKQTSLVTFREIIESEEFKESQSKVTIGLGEDVSGEMVVADLASMPHLLVAGATGSGKSVCINAIINSILFKATPDEVKLLLIDPKMVELNIYNGIPHLIAPVVTDPKKAAVALKWVITEMENRYKLFAGSGARDITSYNRSEMEKGEKPLPQIVVIIDELADLMMVAPHDVEEGICRLAQMARAAGMHIVVATQRPSVDVITGLIKANIPSRISFAVSSQIDSRTILDMNGAEKLLGKGDMLFLPVGAIKPIRVQGAFLSEKEVAQVVKFIKKQGKPEYEDGMFKENITTQICQEGEEDELFPEAVRMVVESGQASISMLQRRLKIGYTRAARLVDMMEEQKIIGSYEGSKPREVLISEKEYRDRFKAD